MIYDAELHFFAVMNEIITKVKVNTKPTRRNFDFVCESPENLKMKNAVATECLLDNHGIEL